MVQRCGFQYNKKDKCDKDHRINRIENYVPLSNKKIHVGWFENIILLPCCLSCVVLCVVDNDDDFNTYDKGKYDKNDDTD